ncbi:sensor histidine kinase [Anaerosporobacter sp.]
MIYIFFVVAVIIGAYFAFRFFLIKYALQETDKQLQDIQKDLTQNQVLHLPIPAKDLGKLMNSINNTLEEIRKERQSYEKREKEFQQTIENISHDLRTPLTVILGYLKFIKKPDKEIDINKDLTETLEVIERKAKSMEKLVTQFYAYSRLSSQDYNLTIHEVDVCRILRETLIDNYQILEQAHLKVDAELPEYPIWIMGEEGALERIFSNLFQNAGRYASNFLNIRIKEYSGKTSISFVNDTDKLYESDVPHLFDRFYMQDNSRTQGGTGLGLTVAKSLAESMDGTLNVEVINSKYDVLHDKNISLCFKLELKNVLINKSIDK